MTGTEWSEMKPGKYKLRHVCVQEDQPFRVTNKQVEGIAYDIVRQVQYICIIHVR